MTSTAHKVTQYRYQDGSKAEGEYLYRGIRIERDDSVRGYSGHWRAKVGSISAGTRNTFTGMTRAVVLAQIDSHLDA